MFILSLFSFYSPSGTKLRTWDELKHYICSDGTCKCGLSCPLRLEQSFSFDPKVCLQVIDIIIIIIVIRITYNNECIVEFECEPFFKELRTTCLPYVPN